ncbi:MAG: acyl-CoA synthetase [Actinobacteria bacterium]|nr:acyl-CoA synthetase [Actinomycetota bacterium]
MSDPNLLGFWKLAEENPDGLAIVEADGTELTNAEVLNRVNQISHSLRALGAQDGDVVATMTYNSAALLEIYMAAVQIGMYVTPINNSLAAPEVSYILDNCEAKAFFAADRFGERAAKAADLAGLPANARISTHGSIDGFETLDDFVAAQPTTAPENRLSGAAMQYTSGTTGKPKGVRRKLSGLDPETMGTLMTMLPSMFGVTPRGDGVHLVSSPLYHTAVMIYATTAMHMGHPIVLTDKWDAETTLQKIQDYKCTYTHMVPTQFNRMLMLDEDTRAKYDVSSMQQAIHAAAPCPPEVKRRMLDWWGPVIWEYYAASEGGGTIASPEDWLAHPGTVGNAWPASDVKILDDDMNELPAGQVGTIYMFMMAGQEFEYYKDKEKTDKNRFDNYFTVGDVGYLDDDGFLFLSDRKIDMIISGGVNIYPAEIEAALISAPGVADVAVFGIPHDDWGEEVKAVIELQDGVEADDTTRDAITAYAADNLARYKQPKTVDFIEAMPRDASGKLYKRKLRDPYWEGRDRAI